MISVLLSNHRDDALLAYLIKSWFEKNRMGMGRTLVQKLCYFLKARSVPLRFEFEIYHYGPYSQELFFEMDNLVADEVVLDQSTNPGHSEYVPGPASEFLMDSFAPHLKEHRSGVDDVVQLFAGAKPAIMELLSTIHYQYVFALKEYKSKRAPTEAD